MLSAYRVQMCQYHQAKIIQRYITNNPDLQASIELLKLSKFMFYTDRESFIRAFEEWKKQWSKFLKERSVDKRTEKTYYTHRKLGSAYLSLRRNMPYLWTYYQHPEVGIPNTNNGLEGLIYRP